ncbi:Sodium/hydrogen exchanger family [Tribonema minus]|uniref:Sodium/hydrogen exchanger family n=1 Tax=Tribonema minus TaxID=303371 RepID=A0A835Z8G2_9STRA|nr:Sodium/hydrogen exchanger family [Tribonema minus]
MAGESEVGGGNGVGSAADISDAGVGAIIFAWALGVFARTVLKGVFPVPHTALLLVLGIIVGLILVFADDAGDTGLGTSLVQIRYIPPMIIFFAALSIPIFNTALHLDVNMFMREVWHVSVVAVIGATVAALLTALFAHYMLPYGWDWYTALYFGAICSATDPVAVVAKLREKGSCMRLSILVEAEALLNNALMVVLFSIFFNASAAIHDISGGFFVVQSIRLLGGGVVLGICVGAISASIIGYILEDPVSELSVVIVAGYAAFLLGDATPLHVSGVTALITCGLYLSVYGMPRISLSVQRPLTELWGLMSFLARTLVFFLAGLAATEQAYGDSGAPHVTGADWGYMIALYLWVYLSRAIAMAVCYPALRWGCFADSASAETETDLRHMAALWWCGVRGILALTLALLVQQNVELPEAAGNRIMFHVCGLVALGLLINGGALWPVLRLIGMDRSAGDELASEVFARACAAIEAKLEQVAEELKQDRFLGDADWPIVWRYIPVMTAHSYWHRIRYGTIMLANGEEQFNSAGDGGGAGGARGRLAPLWGVLRRIGRGLLFVRAAADLASASKFAHLPPRLRDVWQRFHRIYGMQQEPLWALGSEEFDAMLETNVNAEHGNERYRSLDGTVHMPQGPGRSRSSFTKGESGGGGGGGTPGLPKRFLGRGLDDSRKTAPSNSAAGSGVRRTVTASPLGSQEGLDKRAEGGAEGGAAMERQQSGGSDHAGSTHSTPGKKLTASMSAASFMTTPNALVRGSSGGGGGGGGIGSSGHLGSLGHHQSLHLLGPHPDASLKELRLLKDSAASAREKLKRVEEQLRAAERSAEKSLAARTPVRGAGAAAAAGREGEDGGSLSGSRPGRGGSGHRKGKAPKQLEDRGDSISPTPDALHDHPHIFNSNASRAARRSTAAQAEFDMQQLAEARLRFITAVKANYVINYKSGWLTTSGLRVLQDNADEQLDKGNANEPLGEWDRLRVSFTLPDYQVTVANALRHTPFLGQIVGGWVFEKLAFVFMLAKNFILAHEGIDMTDLLPEGAAAQRLAQVSARFMLHRHREVVEELMRGGFINEREGEALLHRNAVSHTLLHDHPYADHLPPRTVLLSKVPFLRQLNDEDLKRIVEDESCCSEQFHGSNVVLIRNGAQTVAQGPNKSSGAAGWYYIVRGTVHMISENPVKGRRQQVLHAGAVFGMTDQMLGRPFRGAYTTASFVHVFYFDKDRLLAEAARCDDLNRSLWRTVGVTVLRKFVGFNRMRLNELHKLVYSSEFVDLSRAGVGEETSEVALRVEQIRARMTASSSVGGMRHGSISGSTGDAGTPTSAAAAAADDGAIHIKKMSRDPSGTSLKQALRQMGLYEGDFDDYLQGQQRHAHVASGGSVAGSGSSGGIAQARSPPMLQGPKAAAHTSLKIVDVDASYYVLLVTGQLLPRPATDTAPAVEAQDAPCLLTDVEGRLVVTTATKLFLIPVSAISRVRSRLAGDPARGLRAEDSLGALKDHAIHRARAADLDALNSLDAAGLGRSPNLGPVLGPSGPSATISPTSASSQMFGEGLDVSSGGPPLLPHHRHHVVSQHHRPLPQVQWQ